MDQFAQIAANGIGGRMDLLEERKPAQIEKRVCRLLETQAEPMPVPPKMATHEELKIALQDMREKYKPFLENYAPLFTTKRAKVDIKKFVCNGSAITIPEYGGPLGNASKVYISEFELPELALGQTAYIHFDGADYYAVVYVNGTCVGTHEGFFSPFEFDITEFVCVGKNELKVELYNDCIYMGTNLTAKDRIEGDKLYAATGLGWDDAQEGWHHCPPGMGIFDDVYVEIRNEVHISDIFVRPMENVAELWVEIEYRGYMPTETEIHFSVYGQNFNETVFENHVFVPETMRTVGMGDSLTESEVGEELGKGIPMPLKHGKNIYKIPFAMENAKIWDLETPYLYQIQVSVVVKGEITDTTSRQFGMRTFKQDTDSEIKGMFYLNNRPIRLRGANTMGFEQQDVMRGDFNQLIDDILLAKLCNMNFLRLTQRPVQDEIYEHCDKLGLMTQTDLPLFGCMRRNKVTEGIRQAEEMERIVRAHPCNVLVSYINEPFPNANNEPHRHLERHELESFFACCDVVIKMQNPDRVIKHVDGDYDPPTESMPDNHCYPMWYNGHGIDIGKLHKGYWLPVRPGWYYGCGEYGAEGLDSLVVMEEMYPQEWLKEPFNPKRIIKSQTADFHYFFYETPEGIENWIEKSQEYQAFATKMMTEAFRRDNRMVSNAIHLFIDAWPSGWMKTIMDCKRIPKQSYFAYRDSLEPLMLSLRTDRFTYTVGEVVSVEVHLCNDTDFAGDYQIVFELYNTKGKLIKRGLTAAVIEPCKASYVVNAEFLAITELDRENFILKAVLTDNYGKALTYAEQSIEVFSECEIVEHDEVVLIEKLPIGTHEIAGEKVTVKSCGMLPLHFVSRATGHPFVAEFTERDFAYWYDKEEDMITPILETTFEATGFTPILISGNMDENGKWMKTLAAAEKVYKGRRYVICQLDLRTENPVAKRFKKNILAFDNQSC